MSGTGALAGLKVIEIAGIGPGPFAAMMLADHGATVIRIERPGTPPDPTDVLNRTRSLRRIDLKSERGREEVLALCADADVLIEGFRPGVMERLGLDPDTVLGINPRLVYCRVTGWGQQGPMAHAAGHDINYIALNGVLHALGRRDQKPTPPINLVGDFGGGGMLAAFGILAGVLSARATGQGQVIDAAMIDGSALLMSMMWGFRDKGVWCDARGQNYLDTGEPYYDTYRTADDRYIAIGAIEPQFYAELLRRIGAEGDPVIAAQNDEATREERREAFAALFASKTRDQWCELLEGSDACFAPVLDWEETPHHPHIAGRETIIAVDGRLQPAPAPRFSLTPAPAPRAPGVEAVEE